MTRSDAHPDSFHEAYIPTACREYMDRAPDPKEARRHPRRDRDDPRAYSRQVRDDHPVCRGRQGHHGDNWRSSSSSPEAEDGGHRHPRGRHRPRLQQHARSVLGNWNWPSTTSTARRETQHRAGDKGVQAGSRPDQADPHLQQKERARQKRLPAHPPRQRDVQAPPPAPCRAPSG